MRNIFKSILGALLALASCTQEPAFAVTTSTINPGLPAQGAPISSAPLRQNFTNAYNDINNLYALIAAGIENNPPGGILGQLQYNAGGGLFGGLTMSGDCTLTYSTGVIICTKSNGVTLGIFAALIPSGSVVPTNGIYYPNTNTVGFATNTVFAGEVDPNQRLIWNGTTSRSIGATPVNPYIQLQGQSDDTSTIGNYRYSADAFSSSISFAKSRGTSIGAQTAVQLNDELGKVRFYGSDGTAFQLGASIRAYADAVPSSGIVPTRMSWWTANAAGTLTEGLRQDRLQHLVSNGAAPTCGTGCTSVAGTATDVRGYWTTGSSVTSSVLNFANTYDSAPYCTISTNTTASVADINALTASALTVNFASSVTSVKVYYHCIQ